MKSFSDLQEVLTKNTKASEFIDDFVKSNNPKFAGKSPAKRKQMALAAYYAKQNEEVIKEDHYVHVNDGSKYDEKPHEKDVEHVMHGVKSHGGEHAGLSDKGVVFKFKSKTDAEGFRSHVNRCPHRSCDAHHIDESVNEGVFQPNGTDNVDYEKGMGDNVSPDKKTKKTKVNGDIKILNGEQEPAIKESDEAWAASQEKKKEDRLSNKDKGTLDKVRSLMAKEKKPVKEAVYVEESRTESGELFKSLVDRAHAASERGDHTQAKRHLANAQTARYGITSGNIAKHKKSFDKYKELKHSYTNSDDHVREDISIDEAHKINDRVEIIKGSAKGTKGHIGEIRHGAYKGAPKTYTVYHGENGAVQVPKEHIRKLKEQEAVMPSYTKEEVEKLDEISKDTLRSYANKAFAQGNDLHYDLAHSKGDKATDAERAVMKAKLSKRNDGVIKASQKLNREDMDEAAIDHQHRIARDTVKNPNKSLLGGPSAKEAEETLRKKYGYDDKKIAKLKEAVDTVKRDEKGKVIAWSHEGDWEKMSTKNKQGFGKAANLAGKAMQQTKKLAKEEVEEIDEKAAAGDWHVHDSKSGKIHSTYDSHRKAINAMKKLNGQHDGYETPGGIIQSKYAASAASYHKEDINESAWGRDKMSSLRQAHDRHMEKALAANKAGNDEATKVHQRKMQMIQGKMQKLKQNEEVSLGEECEILFELNKKTLGSYVNKANDQLMKHTASVNFKQGRGDSDAFAYAHDKEAVRKTANRTQGVKTAISKLTKEEVEEFMQTEAYEQLDELDKDTLKSYVNKASQNARIQGMMQADYKSRGEHARNPGMKKAWDKMSDDARSKGWKRQDGIKTAVNKLTKEDTMLTYSEFMAQLAEGKADDLKDKLAADREARLNNYDYSHEKAAKKSPVQKVKGHSYGAGEEEGEDDEGTTKTSKPTSEKRGRGRPTGSKSGARV